MHLDRRVSGDELVQIHILYYANNSSGHLSGLNITKEGGVVCLVSNWLQNACFSAHNSRTGVRQHNNGDGNGSPCLDRDSRFPASSVMIGAGGLAWKLRPIFSAFRPSNRAQRGAGWLTNT